jgi:ubiquitin carboxyl-terminal hydrolase 22/27/51
LTYELSTVIVHKGKIDSGHYVNYCREGNDWFLFDDSKVVLATEAEVLAAEAYLLFYLVGGLEV